MTWLKFWLFLVQLQFLPQCKTTEHLFKFSELYSVYRKIPKNSDTRNICCNHQNIWKGGWVCTVCPGLSVPKLGIIKVIKVSKTYLNFLLAKSLILSKESKFLFFLNISKCASWVVSVLLVTEIELDHWNEFCLCSTSEEWTVILITPTHLLWWWF